MDYEKRYKEALERAETLIEKLESTHIKGFIYHIFPELQESEDERIRKTLIELVRCNERSGYFSLNNIETSLIIAWLEKQGEQTHVELGQSEVTKTSDQELEPKFKVGNWYQCIKNFFGKGVTFDKNTAYYCAQEGCLLNGCHIAIVKDLYDNFKLWTFQDVKDGDVLAFDNDTIVIFKDLYNSSTFHSYCHIEDGLFDVSKDDMPDWWEGKGFHPATEEQRDLLFQKMKEAGYEWDADNKELKKAKVANKESEDELIRKALIDYFDDANKSDENPLQSYGIRTHEVIDWLEKQNRFMIYTKEKFKELWEANEYGSGITYDDIAECAKAWGISSHPRICPIDEITHRVLKAAQVNDAEEYNPNPTPQCEGRIMIDLDKACEWLEDGGYFVNNTETIEDFRTAMMEGRDSESKRTDAW